MKKWIALILALTMMFTLAACGGSNDAADDAANNADDTAELIYAVEAGSAGEAAALENSWNVNSVVDQATALMEVASGTSDAAIIDLLMAGAMIGEGTSYPDLKYTDKLTTEEYGVGCRKGSDLVDVINAVFSATYADGSMLASRFAQGIAQSHNLCVNVKTVHRIDAQRQCLKSKLLHTTGGSGKQSHVHVLKLGESLHHLSHIVAYMANGEHCHRCIAG